MFINLIIFVHGDKEYLYIYRLISQECDEDSDCEHTEYCTNKVCTIPNPGND